MPRFFVWLALSGLAAGSLVGSAIASDALAGDGDDERSLPAFGSPVPLIQPVESAPQPGAPAGTGGGGGSGSLPPVEPVSVLNPYSPSDVPSIPELPALPLPSTREEAPPGFGDPACTGEGGDCATVLGIDADPPIQIVAVIGGICDLGGDGYPAEGIPFTIISSTPGDFVVALYESPATAESRTVGTGSGSTSADESARWLGAARATFVTTCVGVVGIPNRVDTFDVFVEGHAGDSVDTYRTTFVSELQNRPPVVITPASVYFEGTLRVVVPAKSGGDNTGVAVGLFDQGNCTVAETRYGFGGTLEPTQPVAPSVLAAPGYPYDVAWDEQYVHLFENLEPQRIYFLCIIWYEHNTSSDRVEYRLQPPNRYGFSIGVTQVDFPRRRVPNHYGVTTFGGRCDIVLEGRFSVGQRVYSELIDEGGSGRQPRYSGSALGSSQPGCHQGALESLPRGVLVLDGNAELALTVEVHGPEGVATSVIKVPFNPCPADGGACDHEPTSRLTYRVPMSVITGLCGSGVGGGCDPPRSRIAVVTVLVVLSPTAPPHSYDEPAGGTGAWEIGEPVAF